MNRNVRVHMASVLQIPKFLRLAVVAWVVAITAFLVCLLSLFVAGGMYFAGWYQLSNVAVYVAILAVLFQATHFYLSRSVTSGLGVGFGLVGLGCLKFAAWFLISASFGGI
jgi:hypothetical protein